MSERGSDPDRPIARALLDELPEGEVERLVLGAKWLLSIVRRADGTRRAGLANRCADHLETSVPPVGDARTIAQGLAGGDPRFASAALATVNALLDTPPLAQPLDGADWLARAGRGRTVLVVGRFPFLATEIRPVAETLWVVERSPRTGEHATDALPDLLPRADVVAVTASALLEHAVDAMLPHLAPHARLMLLGASTPLAPALLDLGIHLLCGVEVVDVDRAARDVEAGRGFRQLGGLRRLALHRFDEAPHQAGEPS